MFISFKLKKVETRYYITKRKTLTVIRYIAKVKYFIIRYEYLIILYTNYIALESIMRVKIDAHKRIVR